MVAAAGGTTTRTRCTPPRRARIDWIFGPQCPVHRYTTVTGPLAGKTSDHPLIHAHARLPDHR
jgi:hypothetical protein